MKNTLISNWKPQLLPNNKPGIPVKWEERIENPLDYLISTKLDGVRVHIPAEGPGLSREKKVIPNKHVQNMVKTVQDTLDFEGIIECEFYSHEMTFSEIIHFFKSEDVTSDKTKTKYESLYAKTHSGVTLAWKYRGRTPGWLTSWQHSLQFYVFDHYLENDTRTKEERLIDFSGNYANVIANSPIINIIPQRIYETHAEIDEAYEKAIDNNFEGLVMIKKNSLYKCNRVTLNSKDAFKRTEDQYPYDGVVLDVEEGTVAREGAPKSINELGRSKTSQLKEDRVPSGIAKGFLVKMDDGNSLTVSLKGFPHAERKKLLKDKSNWVGKTIRFTGKAPVKVGGCPRQAFYVEGNIRDSK